MYISATFEQFVLLGKVIFSKDSSVSNILHFLICKILYSCENLSGKIPSLPAHCYLE